MIHLDTNYQMDDISKIIHFCDCLVNRVEPQKPIIENSSENPPYQEDENVVINRIDIENLSHYAQIWTDAIEIEVVEKYFNESGFDDLETFEKTNYLYNVGFFYVRINPNLSILEFFGLISKIPWENLRSPGLDQIPYTSITNLLGEKSEKVAIQLMVLGDFFKFWILINPYKQMSQANEATRLLLSAMGTLAIKISPNFLANCKEMIETIDL